LLLLLFFLSPLFVFYSSVSLYTLSPSFVSLYITSPALSSPVPYNQQFCTSCGKLLKYHDDNLIRYYIDSIKRIQGPHRVCCTSCACVISLFNSPHTALLLLILPFLLSSPFLPCHVPPCPLLPYSALSYHTRLLPCLFPSYHALLCLIQSYPALLYPALPYHVAGEILRRIAW
jgi:hypothetical protein